MNTLVVSDVHLNVAEDGRPTRETFVRFLRTIGAAEYPRIVILGDLFDFWFEYRHVIFSGYFEILRPLADLRDAGVEFHFICGNHDFWAGRFFSEQLGFTIHRRHAHLPFGDRRALLIHGDGLRPSDKGYRIYKRIARSRPVVAAFRLIHPDWAMGLAQLVSRGSRHFTAAEHPSQGREVQPLRDFAKGVLARGEADVVMCGHSHFPGIEEYPSPSGKGLYINTGDWLYHRSYVVWKDGAFELRYFEPDVEAGGPELERV